MSSSNGTPKSPHTLKKKTLLRAHTNVVSFGIQRGAYPSPLNYHGFPKSCCTSVNEVICHGIPDDRKLQKGDIINLDITCYLDGYHGDCSEMFVVGGEEAADPAVKRLLQTTYDCWVSAMNIVQPGRDYKDIGGVVEDYVVQRGFSTVKNFCGHGIGSVFHTNPNILHYKNNEPNGQMAPGHTFTIEPMICEGSGAYFLSVSLSVGLFCCIFADSVFLSLVVV